MLRPLLLAALVALLPACRPGTDAEASEPLSNAARRREATQVRTAPVLTREMVRTLSTTTTLESETQVDVFPRVGGVVTAVHFEEGDAVGKDAVLATIDQREAQARLKDAEIAHEEAKDAESRLALSIEEALERAKRAELAYQQARSEYERNVGAGLISEIDLGKLKLTQDTSERDWKAALLAHKGAEQDHEQQQRAIDRASLTVEREELALSFTQISAPFAGVVSARMVRVGDTVSAGTAAFTLTDADHLRCVVPRPQIELPFFHAARAEGGQVDIRVRPEAYPGQVYRGQIRILSPTIDPASGSFRLTIGLDQPAPGDDRPRLQPGMMVRVSIVTERHPDALVVPKRALRREGDRHFLYLDRDGVAERVEVIEGFTDSEHVEVRPLVEGAVTVGTPVVVVGNRDLEDGEEIEAEAWAPAEASGGARGAALADGAGQGEEDGDEVAAADEGAPEGTEAETADPPEEDGDANR